MARALPLSDAAPIGAQLRGLGAGGVILVGVAWAADPALRASGLPALAGTPLPVIGALYLGAHLLRAARTVVILGDQTRSLRAVLLAHLASAPWAGLLPHKLGELVRMWAVGRVSDGLGEGLRVVWIERTFDAALFALAAGTVVLLRPEAAPIVAPIAALAVGMLFATATAVVALPENLRTARHWLLMRYTADWSNAALAALDAVGDALAALRRRVRGKVATLLGLSVGLWGLEAAALWLLAGAGAPGLEGVLLGLLGVLSGVIGADQGAPDLARQSIAWRMVICGAAAVLGGAAATLAPWLSARRAGEER